MGAILEAKVYIIPIHTAMPVTDHVIWCRPCVGNRFRCAAVAGLLVLGAASSEAQHESLALVAHDMRARQIDATLNLSSNPCIITGDQVRLQQVLVNLVMNAMDAMAETPPARRHVTISTDARAADVEVSVRDAGTGVPAQINGTLFTPFVTTKAHGLGIGLTITQTTVDAHRGTIDARNNPEGGATFTVTLRRSETPQILSGPPSAA